MTSGIYVIKNIQNNKVYIGSSIDYKRRCRKHYTLLIKDNHPNPHLQSSWNKYGEENFTFELLVKATEENLLNLEYSWILIFNALDRRFGYNIEIPIRNRVLDETKKKISISMTGRTLSDSHKQSISKAFKGKPWSKERRENLGDKFSKKLTNRDAEMIRRSKEQNVPKELLYFAFDISKSCYYQTCRGTYHKKGS